jgi:hypothetical protein
MTDRFILPESVAPQAILGYLNFSEGRPDPRFQKQLNDAYAHLVAQGSKAPWQDLFDALTAHLHRLHDEGNAAFRDMHQVEAVLPLAFREILLSYRAHHRDLLTHQGAAELWQPFFLARVCEAVLSQRGPWEDTERVVLGSLRQLNDYVGHRPVAVLEGRRRGEPYDHERIRPIPLYLRGAGVAWGKYQELLERALPILQMLDSELGGDASFDFELLDEFAFDPRGYDFGHPAEKRPNYCFGEWDPHQLDGQARYRRYVARQVLLDALLQRVDTSAELPRAELIFEAAAVLAGTVLMATGVSGAGPETHDSTVTLSNLVPRIARYREKFYERLLRQLSGEQGARLRSEAQRLRQPFGGARQHLNHYLARQRALQLQSRHLALFWAELGYPAASQRRLADIPVASVRMVTEMHQLLTTGHLRLDGGELTPAAAHLAQVEDLLRRGIACGALADPWNILGFQGQYPRFQSLEDSVRDGRIEELVRVVGRTFDLSARLLSEAAAAGDAAQVQLSARDMKRLADWWDHFATTTVSDIPHVHGGEAAAAAQFVAAALARWRQHGTADDLAFWREQLEQFRTPKAFALVVAALLERREFRAALALLMTWLSQAELVPLVEGTHSFHELALRWMLALSLDAAVPARQAAAFALVVKFFDYLEANAEENWHMPRLDLLGVGEAAAEENDPPADAEEEDSVYGAAYEEMTYQDSTDDDVEAEVLDVMPQKDFDLTYEAERLEARLRFQATLARLWNVATRTLRAGAPADEASRPAAAWLARAQQNYRDLLGLLDTIHHHEIPRPTTGSFEAMVEYDRRNVAKERLLNLAIATGLDLALAVGSLRGVCPDDEKAEGLQGAAWEPYVLELERALLGGDTAAARLVLPKLLDHFRAEPLLYTPLGQGGSPRSILRALLAQTVLRGLAYSLPRQGLVRETYQLLRRARAMEAGQTLPGPRVTEFDRLFQIGLQACVEALADAAQREQIEPARLGDALEASVEPFLALWMDHSQTTRVAALEMVASQEEWAQLRAFIENYGRDLFTPRFLAIGNLRGILHRGVGKYVESLRANPDPAQPLHLLDDLEQGILSNEEAGRRLHLILHALLEGYDHYRDYATTVAQSDYGDHLFHLFEFLRLRAGYERTAWRLRPLNLVHEVLARRDGRTAALWRDQVQQLTHGAAEAHLQELSELESAHGMRLTTVRDRLEERFVGPMSVDRLCALVEPALAQARTQVDADIPCPLEAELRPFADHPLGVGMEVPPWLGRLEHELQRVRAAQSALGNLSETLLHVPRLPVPFVALAEQLRDWKQLALDES